jgi:CPA2 family monovalent cation:H+ antiporter-2
VHDAHDFLSALAIVLCVAAFTTVLFQRLRQPVVLGYILAGVIVGPHVPIPLVADPAIVHTLSELGVILLMFALGLEFSLRKLASVGATAGITAVLQCSALFWLGYTIATGFGWTRLEALFTGAIIAISSTTIIAKAFDEQGVRGRLRELVVGVLIVEDLIAILLMAALTTIASGSGLSAASLLSTTGRLLAFLVTLVVVGMLVVPRLVRSIVRLRRDETTLVASVGICFAIALLAHAFGYSVALGAFLAGSLVAESGEAHEIERLVWPVRDVFAAVFFVSVGMTIDPRLLATYALPIVALTLTVIAGKIGSVALGAFFTGNGVRTSLQAGMSLAQIGEFSFIIAGLGLTLGVTGEFLYPVAVAVSAVTTLTTPGLIRASEPLARRIDRALPARLQTFVTLYGSWLEQLRAAPREGTRSPMARFARVLLIDAALLGCLVAGAALAAHPTVALLTTRVGLPWTAGAVLFVAVAIAASAPFALGMIRSARTLGDQLASRALPSVATDAVDLAATARRALRLSLEALILGLVVLPVVAITQPLLPAWGSLAVVATLLVMAGVALWRGTSELDAHVRAGAQVVLEALARQSASTDGDTLHDVRHLLPGIGEPESLRIPEGSPITGRTLAALDLRGVTGATVLAIARDGRGVALPGPDEVLHAGDVLAVAGTHEAIAAVRELVCGRP